jgi:hypothetical protein
MNQNIDNYQKAVALTEKMKTQVPFVVYPHQGLLEIAKQQGDSLNVNQELKVIDVMYAGDEGGIMCALESRPEEKAAYVCSLTHLQVPDDHPLATEIQAYQLHRTVRLALAHGKIGRARRLAKSRSKKKGFGI